MRTTCVCGKSAIIPERLIGRLVRCPRCGTILSTAYVKKSPQHASRKLSNSPDAWSGHANQPMSARSFSIWLIGTAAVATLLVTFVVAGVIIYQSDHATAGPSVSKAIEIEQDNSESLSESQSKTVSSEVIPSARKSPVKQNAKQSDTANSLATRWAQAIQQRKSEDALALCDRAYIDGRTKLTFSERMGLDFPGGEKWLETLWSNESLERSLVRSAVENEQLIEVVRYEEIDGKPAPLIRLSTKQIGSVPSFINLLMHTDNFGALKIIDYFIWDINDFVFGVVNPSKRKRLDLKGGDTARFATAAAEAQVAILLGKYEEAFQKLQAIPNEYRDYYPIQMLLLRSARRLGIEQLRTTIRQQLQVTNNNPMTLLTGLASCMENGDYSTAIELLDILIPITDEDSELVDLKTYCKSRLVN